MFKFFKSAYGCMSDVNVVRKRAETILRDGINKYFYPYLCGFMASFRELDCHTV
jgi:hypothetical protein